MIPAALAVAADSIDPAPIREWVLLAAACIVIIGSIVAALAWGWKYVVRPQIVDIIDGSLDPRIAEHKNVHADIDKRLREEAKERAEADRRLHERIDRHIAEHGT